jgi:hypothetical protein
MFTTMAEVREANRRAGQHFFDPDTMRFFGSRVGSVVYPVGNRVLFVTSEQDRGPGDRAWHGERLYTVREAKPDGGIATVSEFGQFTTHHGAVAFIKRLAAKVSV